MGTGSLPVDWYRSTFSGDRRLLFWDGEAEDKVALALKMLEPTGEERILDLACTSGQRTLELSRRGFCVVGTDLDEFLLEIGGCEAVSEDLYPLFLRSDPRELAFLREFDLVLSLGGGAFGYFGQDDDDRHLFQLVSQALRPGGRLLLQTPNVVYVESHLPDRTWLEAEHGVMLIEQRWEAETRRIVGEVAAVIDDEVSGGLEPAPFERRVYSVEELARIFESVGMELVDVFDEDGSRCAPTDDQQEIFVEASF